MIFNISVMLSRCQSANPYSGSSNGINHSSVKFFEWSFSGVFGEGTEIAECVDS